jgi:hypothetical protein
MNDEIRVQQVIEEAAVDAQNRRVAVLRITFTVGAHGPFYERIPKAEFNPETMRAKLEEFARGLGRLPGASGG